MNIWKRSPHYQIDVQWAVLQTIESHRALNMFMPRPDRKIILSDTKSLCFLSFFTHELFQYWGKTNAQTQCLLTHPSQMETFYLKDMSQMRQMPQQLPGTACRKATKLMTWGQTQGPCQSLRMVSKHVEFSVLWRAYLPPHAIGHLTRLTWGTKAGCDRNILVPWSPVRSRTGMVRKDWCKGPSSQLFLFCQNHFYFVLSTQSFCPQKMYMYMYLDYCAYCTGYRDFTCRHIMNKNMHLYAFIYN